MSNFAENLRKARESKGITKTRMANALGLSLTAYSLYEKGENEPNLTNLKYISIILDVSIDDLLSYDDSDFEKYSIEKCKLEWLKRGYEIKEVSDTISIFPPNNNPLDFKPIDLPKDDFIKLTKAVELEKNKLSIATDMDFIDFSGAAYLVTDRYRIRGRFTS